MDLNNINQDEIIEKITNEVLEELQESNNNFTNEDIQEKINTKIEEFLSQLKDEQFEIEKAKNEKEDEFLKNEFTDIKEKPSDPESVRNNDTKFSSFQEEVLQELSTDETNKENEKQPEEEKKFFQEFADLYKKELQNSMESFKNTLNSFSLMKESSFIEVFLIFLFLAIPAILAGLIGFFFIGLLFVMWQIYILIQMFAKKFDKIEKKLKSTIEKIKVKISTIKNSGGFFNRLIFSNFLYSILMINGILYVFIKGIAFPIRSFGEIDKILANLIGKTLNLATVTLRAPSELALNSSRTNNLIGGKGKSRASTGPVKQRQTLRLNERMTARNRAENLLNSKLNKIQNIAKQEKERIKPKISLDQNEIKKSIFDKVQKSVVENQVKNLMGEKIQKQDYKMQVNEAKNSNKNDQSPMTKGKGGVGNSDFGTKVFNQVLKGGLKVLKNAAQYMGDNIRHYEGDNNSNSYSYNTTQDENTQRYNEKMNELNMQMKQEDKKKNDIDGQIRSLENLPKNDDGSCITEDGYYMTKEDYNSTLKDLKQQSKSCENEKNDLMDNYKEYNQAEREGRDFTKASGEIETKDAYEAVDGLIKLLDENGNNIWEQAGVDIKKTLVESINYENPENKEKFLYNSINEQMTKNGYDKEAIMDFYLFASESISKFVKESDEASKVRQNVKKLEEKRQSENVKDRQISCR